MVVGVMEDSGLLVGQVRATCGVRSSDWIEALGMICRG